MFIDLLHSGDITQNMFTTMFILYTWSDWDTGIVRFASASGIAQWFGKDEYGNRISVSTVKRTLRRLEQRGFITRHMIKGSRKSYSITIHNYKVWEAGEEGVTEEKTINPKKTVFYEENCLDGDPDDDPELTLKRPGSDPNVLLKPSEPSLTLSEGLPESTKDSRDPGELSEKGKTSAPEDSARNSLRGTAGPGVGAIAPPPVPNPPSPPVKEESAYQKFARLSAAYEKDVLAHRRIV
jgi:hypothetical protein